MGISARSRTVLSQVVTLHYRTCEPVGSALVSRTPELTCSPATIRNIMVRLESKGYLCQPHTSAGRLPTDLGYRAYVDGIKLAEPNLSAVAQTHLESAISQAPNAASALQMVADYIQKATNLVSFSLPFRHCGFRLGHLHLERLNADRLLAVWVSRGGQSFQSLLGITEEALPTGMVEKTANYFNNAFQGKTLLQIHRMLRMRHGKGGTWDGLLTSAVLVSQVLMKEVDNLESLNFRGVSSVLEMPEFHDVAKVRTICRMLEHKSQMIQLIQKGLEANDEWVLFFIGGEMNSPELEGMTVALGKFSSGDDQIGCVGTLGPKRMPYLKALQILRHAQERMKVASF